MMSFNTFKKIWGLCKKNYFALHEFLTNPGMYDYSKRSFSQEGEDMILARLFEGRKTGFYVDVGAHHPQRFSNTYYFYLQGWQGINIDAMPGSMSLFEKIRPNDINLELAISDIKEKLTYYAFEESALNSFCKTLASEYIRLGHNLIFAKEIQTFTLEEVFQQHLPSHQIIDFISIDVEGLDYQVLQSNNWSLYRPSFLLVEDLRASRSEEKQVDSIKFLKEKNYELFGKTANTFIFKDSSLLSPFKSISI